MMVSVLKRPKKRRRILDWEERLDETVVGGKLSRQRTLAEHGFSVPRFFAITTEFFDEAATILRPQIAARLAAVDFGAAESIRRGASDVQDMFRALTLTPVQEEEILRAFDKHFEPKTLVAVRASTVGHSLAESEDSSDNPFAGMSETFLFTPRDQLIGRVKDCWASGFSSESLVYRHAQGMKLDAFAVGVAVQEMVFGIRSFVLFTCNPKTAARESVIVAGYGIGEGVVQEKVGVDHYFVHGKTFDVKRQVGEKREQLMLDDVAGHGLVVRPVMDDMVSRSCLSDEELGEIAKLGQKVEAIFGAPQDIEGTISKDGRIHLLQSRPIALDQRRMRVWTNANVTESFPGVTTALTYSFSRYFYRVIFRDCYLRLGVSETKLLDSYESLDRMIGFIGGRVYYSLSAFYYLHSQIALFPVFRAHWEKMMGFRASYDTVEASPWSRAMGGLQRGAGIASGVGLAVVLFVNHDRDMRAFHRWWEELIAPLRGDTFLGKDPLIIISEYQRVWRGVAHEWGITLINDSFLPLIYGGVEKAFREDPRLSGDPALLSDLLCGDEDVLSVEIIRSAVRLSETVRSIPPLAAMLRTRSAEEVWAALEKGELDPSFSNAVREHLHRYGDRGLQELKMEQPNLRNQPEALVRIVQGYALSETTVAALSANEAKVRAGGEARLEQALRHAPAKRAMLRVALSTLRGFIRARENSRYCRSELFGFSKNVFHALGAALHARGALRDAGDVVHLTPEEIFGWFDGTGVTENLQGLADTRRLEYEQHKARETSMDITTLGPLPDNELGAPPPTSDDGSEMRGLGSSTGRVRGRARVVLDPTTVGALGPDAILVARETDPGWLFLMLSAKGIVVERGSMLSHTAITGRKFGIPTVVSVAGATSRIPDGAMIEIDGASGVVRLVEA